MRIIYSGRQLVIAYPSQVNSNWNGWGKKNIRLQAIVIFCCWCVVGTVGKCLSFSHQHYDIDYTGCPFYRVPEQQLPWVLVRRKPAVAGNVEFIFYSAVHFTSFIDESHCVLNSILLHRKASMLKDMLKWMCCRSYGGEELAQCSNYHQQTSVFQTRVCHFLLTNN